MIGEGVYLRTYLTPFSEWLDRADVTDILVNRPGEVWIDGARTKIKGDDAFVIPAGARHNVINTGSKALKMYTIYSPPEHRDGFVAATKAAAEASEEHFDGKTTE